MLQIRLGPLDPFFSIYDEWRQTTRINNFRHRIVRSKLIARGRNLSGQSVSWRDRREGETRKERGETKVQGKDGTVHLREPSLSLTNENVAQ